MKIRLFMSSFLLLYFAFSLVAQSNAWQTIAIADLESDVNGIEYDSDNYKIIVHTHSKLKHLFDGYSFSAEVAQDLPLDNNPVDSLTIGPISDVESFKGKQFLATINNGLWVKDGQRIQQFIIEGQDIPINILSLNAADANLYILTTQNNLFVWDAEAYTLDEVNIPKTEYISDFVIDPWEQIWLLGETNIFKQEIDVSPAPPVLNITDIKSQFESLPEPWSDLQFDSENLVVSVDARSHYLKGDELLYQYTIKNDQWSPLSRSSVANLTNLAPGEYIFQMRSKAKDSELGYSEKIPFSITQSFWNSQWPWLIGAISGLFLLWGISFNRQKQELSSIQQSANKYRLENQLLKSKQETRQLQMNPHFMFNSLTTIQGTIAQGDSKLARHLLNQYAQLMRSLLDQSREDQISLKNELVFLKRYLELEQAARNHKFMFSIKIADSTRDDILIPPMIVQPIVENAIVHGLKGLDHQGEISIHFEETSNGLLVVVDDNGVGRNATESDHESHGLQILTERIQSYAKFKSLRDIKIIDKTEKGNPTGTTVNIELPKL